MPRTRRWMNLFRLRVRSMMIGVLAIGACCWEVERVRSQARAVAVIRNAGGKVLYDYEVDADYREIGHGRSPVPERLLRRLGVDVFHNVVEVRGIPDNLQGPPDELSEREMVAIGRLRSLRNLNLEHFSG